MVPNETAIRQLHQRYAANDTVYELVYTHCRIVCEIALWCADRVKAEVDRERLQAAALLHDIGTYVFFGEDGQSRDSHLYPQHAVLGAKLLADEGLDPIVCSLIETHVLLGLSKQEIIDHPWPLPHKDYQPDSLEGRLLCFADRFHSKQPRFNSYETFYGRLADSLPLQADKFKAWAEEFGIPDVPAMAKKYNHPIA